MDQNMKNNLYLLLDSKDAPLARGLLESPVDTPHLCVRVLDDKIDEVMKHREVRLVGMNDEQPALLGRIVRNRDDAVVLEKLKMLGAEIRQNLRMPVEGDSFIYPLSGRWSGRREVKIVDLSCGGVAFSSPDGLQDGEKVEIVIPITSKPVVLRCQVLRQRPFGGGLIHYSTEFIDMCHDEETMVREAVFNLQIKNRAKRIKIINDLRRMP